MKKNILILKNDRAGDLFTSLKLISTLANNSSKLTIYLSELNIGFKFLFKNFLTKEINFNLNFIDKLKIFFDILLNNYDEVYIITPKSFYFYLPIFFKKIKFYAIVYDSNKRLRPNNFLRKFLFKFEIVYRNKLNRFSYREVQLKLIDDNVDVDENCINLTIPNFNPESKKLIDNEYVFFQFRQRFFDDLNWGVEEFKKIINLLSSKYKNVLFSSDIEKNERTFFYNNFFEKSFSIIDFNKNTKSIINKKNIFYLKDLDSLNLFFIIKHSKLSVTKDGVVSHISYFLNKKSYNLFNFKIKNLSDYNHEKISYSEWYKGMNFKFSFLNTDINKAIKKISRNI